MQYVRLKRIIFTFFVTILFVAIAEAAEFRFTADVDKTRMSHEDVLVLSFIISGENIVTDITPTLPDLKKDFDILQGPHRSSSISIINGKYTSSISYQYVLSAKKTGTLEIGPATVQYDKKTYKTNPVTIEVFKGTPPQVPSQTPQPQQPEKGQPTSQPEVFIRAEVDKKTAYIGEQVTISYLLYTQISIAGYNVTQQPPFTGFWVEELPIPDPPKLQYKDINGQRYGVALMKNVALFPTSSGEVTIDPMVMRLSVKTSVRPRTGPRDPFDQFFDDPFDNFFGRTQDIIRKTQPLVLNILPLPEENRPETFNGDVGSFTMSVTADKTEVKQDEPMTLTVKIQGTGNIKTVKEPVVTLPDAFKQYDAEITENPFPLQEPMQGEKIFESVIIPTTDGKYQIEPVQFSYFDPQRQAYQTLRSQPIRVVILPKTEQEEPLERRITTKEEIKLLGKDIRFIKTGISQLDDQGRYWYQNSLFQALHLLPILALCAAYGYRRYKQKYLSDASYVRQRRANKLSKKTVKKCL